MRIIHELNQLDFGGVEKIIRNIIKYDKENEHSVVAYKDGPFKKELEKVGAKIFMPEKDRSIDIETDIIHVHCGGEVSEMALNLGKNFPVVETIHSPIRSPLRDEFVRQRVGVTEAVSRLNTKCITIHNGLDLEELESTKSPEEIKKELGIPEGVPVIGRLGRLGFDKCLEDWMLTCHYLQKQIDFVPLIVGKEAKNCSGYIGKLKLMAECLPVKNVVWAGHKSDIANYLQIMDVFLYPSPTEGFGLVFAEAMYMGAVVVTYKNPVSMEIVGGYGILTDPNLDGLIYGTTRALQTEIKDAIVPLAHSFVETGLNAERMTQEYLELYKNVAKAN